MCPKLKSDAMTKKVVRLVVLSDLMVVLKFRRKKNDPYMVYQRPEVDIFFRLVGLTYLPTYISIRSSH